MQVSASGLVRTARFGLAPSLVLALLVGCDSGGGAPVPASRSTDSQGAPTKPPTLTLQEKKKARGAARAASGAQPSDIH
jgi:hypothetical protein